MEDSGEIVSEPTKLIPFDFGKMLSFQRWFRTSDITDGGVEVQGHIGSTTLSRSESSRSLSMDQKLSKACGDSSRVPIDRIYL